jgi:hypothetical protein
MCKINGHSIFTYLAQPWNTKALASSDKRQRALNAAAAEAAKNVDASVEGDEISESAKTAQINKTKKNQSLSSLRTPLEAQDVGASVNSSSVGLNLGG